mmetsp:Transcript_36922/g.75245  ORF Transcript_36922/g.75245 Transcript_36922/m.75245 type:complete len:80 (+) Transcript_36922:415-654(+)
MRGPSKLSPTTPSATNTRRDAASFRPYNSFNGIYMHVDLSGFILSVGLPRQSSRSKDMQGQIGTSGENPCPDFQIRDKG